jgi:hypothetical protein
VFVLCEASDWMFDCLRPPTLVLLAKRLLPNPSFIPLATTAGQRADRKAHKKLCKEVAGGGGGGGGAE